MTISSSDFVAKEGRGEFDDVEFEKTMAYFGVRSLPEQYVGFLKEHFDSYCRLSIGFEALECPYVLGPVEIREASDGHHWGKEFIPFMAMSYAFVALDMRLAAAGGTPPIVLLEWSHEEDYSPIPYEKVVTLAPDFDGFVALLGLWKLPAGFPQVKQCWDIPFLGIGKKIDQAIFLRSAGPGYVLRTGRLGPDGLRVGTMMGCVDECAEEPELAEELNIRSVWERFRPYFGDKVLPFMTGEDGWLALDFRTIDVDPPVVFVARDGGTPSSEPVLVALSVMDAYAMFI